MSAADLCGLGIGELARRYRARDVSPVDVATAHLAAIEKLDKTLWLLLAGARKERISAAEADAEWGT